MCAESQSLLTAASKFIVLIDKPDTRQASQLSASFITSTDPGNWRAVSVKETPQNGSSRAAGPESDSIGLPFNVRHVVHVDEQLQWTGEAAADEFKIECRVGTGGFGSVYRAKHNSGQDIAVKIIQGGTDEVAAIQKEILILKSCRNANVVAYIGSLVSGEDVWIMMDYCAGGSVSDLMERFGQTLIEPEIASVCAQALRGLAYMHSINIIHRDVKAANLLLTSDGLVKLADFGVSTMLQTVSQKAKTVIGTPFWIAPEVLQHVQYDFKADIWSLGITALEMAEGLPPLLADMEAAEALRHIPTAPPPTFAEPGLWSDDFQDFICLCLQHDPADRPTAFELLNHPFITEAGGIETVRELIESSFQAEGTAEEADAA